LYGRKAPQSQQGSPGHRLHPDVRRQPQQ